MITKDHHFELLPDINATDGAAFGIGLPVGLDANGFVPGSTDWAVQDGENAKNGATSFGRDRLLGPSWNWQLHINEQNEADALKTLRAFRKAWHWSHGREVPGKVTALRFMLDGERRRIYGRPRRFEAPPDNRILGGYVPVSIDFKCADGNVYSDEMTSVSLNLGPYYEGEGSVGDSGGGFMFPLTFPTDPLPPTKRQTALIVEGDEPAYPIIRFYGPVTNPGFVTDGWRIDIRYNLAANDFIEVDTRPWANTVLLNGNPNASLGGLMGSRQRISKMRFQPGRFTGQFVGKSSAAATCLVRWETVWSSY